MAWWSCIPVCFVPLILQLFYLLHAPFEMCGESAATPGHRTCMSPAEPVNSSQVSMGRRRQRNVPNTSTPTITRAIASMFHCKRIHTKVIDHRSLHLSTWWRFTAHKKLLGVSGTERSPRTRAAQPYHGIQVHFLPRPRLTDSQASISQGKDVVHGMESSHWAEGPRHLCDTDHQRRRN